MYANDASRRPVVQRESKRKVEKMLSMAMDSFMEPTVLRLHKIKSPLRSAVSVVFSSSTDDSSSGLLQRSGGLMVADRAAGKILEFGARDGRYYRDLVSGVEPHDMAMCGQECLAVVDSNEWGSCVKLVSVDTGQVLATWGRDLKSWTPRAIATTRDEQLVVSNVHAHATSRLTLFTHDGRQVSQFGRAVGPGDLVFKSPLSLAFDNFSGRIFAADADTSCVKIFDARSSLVGEFGSRVSGSTTGNTSAILDRPVGVCCDSRGNAIVCDSGHQRLVLFSREGQYLCTLFDFRSAPRSPRRWRPMRRQGDDELFPVCVGLSAPGSRLAISLEQQRRFRKLVVHSVKPGL